MTKSVSLYTLIFSLLLGSCILPYDFNPENYQRSLVVDGSLTNETKAHTVRLFYTQPIDSPVYQPATQAVVSITDGDGVVTYLTETYTGTYQTMSDFSGVAGQTYQLTVETADGRSYQTRPVTLLLSPPIDSLYMRYEYLPSDETHHNEGGIQFFVDSHDDTGNTRYFRYDWEETYRIQVPFPSLYDNNLVYRTSPLGTCYQTNVSKSFHFATATGTGQTRVAEFPIHFVFQYEQQLRTRYSLKVKQYAISDEAYQYFQHLNKNNEGSGSLFDQQQGAIIGNVFSVDDASEIVLGYFEVAGVSERREFYNPRDLPPPFRVPPYLYHCPYNDIIISSFDSVDYYLNTNPFLLVYMVSTFTPPVGVYLASRECADCSWYASTIKPDFWID
ncbi:MAG: DUF4249 domain-containing protein [Cyclobacteriaceae bacterium]|nr:DUF4249 domain-containing protein [Cyclobacteriaceae bacterium]